MKHRAAMFALSGLVCAVLARSERFQDQGMLGLPSVEALRQQLSLNDVQTKKVAAIYDEYEDRAREVEEKGDANLKARVRREMVVLIKEVCTSDQRQMLDQIVAEVE
jgi:hypothetical protein